MHVYNDNDRKISICDLIKGSQGRTWAHALRKECGRSAQGNNNGVLSKDRIEFIDP